MPKKPVAVLVLLCAAWAWSQSPERYQKPPKEILDVLNAPFAPSVSVSPARDNLILIEQRRYPPIADVAQPMLRLAGIRINPATGGLHTTNYAIGYKLKRIVSPADSSEIRVQTPAAARLSSLEWSPDGKHFAFTNTVQTGIELWIGDSASGSAHRVPGVAINGVMPDPISWMPDSRTLVAQTIPAGRGKPPGAPSVPAGPNIQESAGAATVAWTYQDLLKNPHDEILFGWPTK